MSNILETFKKKKYEDRPHVYPSILELGHSLNGNAIILPTKLTIPP